MVCKFLNKRSKRMTCRKKYKIERKVREHKRKIRKLKKNQPGRLNGKRSDPGVPNSAPFKDQILKEAEEAKALKEEERQKRREEIKEQRKALRENIVDKKRNIGQKIHELLGTAEQRGSEYFERQAAKQKSSEGLSDNSAKSFYREFKKVVECANVILEVLDARDPLGTRCPQMESAVTSHPNKRLVLVLNKADLVPRDNLEKWLSYLRREYPTVVFKSCTQSQSTNLSRSKASPLNSDALNSSRCIGADVLIQLLKNYSRNKDTMMAIDVGVVGLPNVGKSSLINSLKRKKSCGVGATPGFTKNMQTIQIDSKVRLLDSPGIVLPGGDVTDGVAALRNTIKLETLDDAVAPVQAIYNKCKKSQLSLHYGLPEFKDYEEFLVLLAKRLKKMKKGGIPDVDLAARAVLYDWTVGKIKYYTDPPVLEDTEVSASVVSQLSEEFSLDSLKEEESMELSELPMIRPSDLMCVETAGPVDKVKESDDEQEMEESEEKEEEEEEEETDEDMDDEEEEHDEIPENVKINLDTKSPKKKEAKADKPAGRVKPVFDASKMSLKKFQKAMSKKKRKEKNRNVARAESLLNAFESMGSIKDKKDDAYDFKDYFDCK